MARRVAGSRSSTRTRETRKNPLPSGTEGSQETAEMPAVLSNESPGLSPPAPAVDRSRRYPRILLILFLCTLPLVNPIVHGNGVGYYAYEPDCVRAVEEAARLCVDLGREVEEAAPTWDAKLFTSSFMTPWSGGCASRIEGIAL